MSEEVACDFFPAILPTDAAKLEINCVNLFIFGAVRATFAILLTVRCHISPYLRKT